MNELEERMNKLDVDICMIQESKLRKQDRTPIIKGYSAIRADRVGTKGGGLITYVRMNISYEKINHYQKDGTETLTIRIKQSNRKWIQLTNFYCPPNNTLPGNPDKLLRLDLLPTSKNAIIAGDFNAHSPIWDNVQKEDERGEILETWVSNNDLHILNDGSPTRINKGTVGLSTLDISIVGSNWSGTTDWVVEDDIGASDHQPILISVRDQIEHQVIRNRPPKWKRNADWVKFGNMVEEKVTNLPEEGNLTKRVHRFQQILTDVANVVVGKTKPNSKIKSWMNPTIRSAIKKRNTLRKEAATRRQEWLDCCAEVAKMKKSAKEDAW